MSFQGSFPRTFSNASIRTHAPSVSGVYGISNGHEWILIEASDDIRAGLLGHTNVGGKVEALQPTGFSFEICDAGTREWRRDVLLKKFVPVYGAN